MRLSSLSLAVAVAFIGLSSAQATPITNVTTAGSARAEQARALGFDQADFSADGRNNVMIKNAGTLSARAAGLRARNVDEVGTLLRGTLAEMLNLSAGHDVQLDQFNELADGRKYYRMTQTYRGIPVFGDNITVQTDAAGNVEAVFGSGITIGNLDTGSRTNGVEAIKAATNAALQADGAFGANGARTDIVFDVQPHLVVYALFGHAPTLAWEATVHVDGTSSPFASRIFADASSGALLNNITLITHAINRRVYDVANGCVNDSGSVTFPAGTTLKVSEGGSTAGQIQQVVDAYYQLGAVYWYFKNNFGRDSYDNAGGMMSGYVRSKFQSESCNGGNNAFWYNRMMVMGAGGTSFHDLSQSKDVTFHEIGHGVTEYTSGLIYQKEPGGLNEASSDIWGAAIEAWTNSFAGDPGAGTAINYAPNAATWTMGEGLDVSNGDPLRWMNDPERDGYSADEYSDYTSRWGNCTPSSSNDRCGVHGSSGIANLAFHLMSQGGTHPRGATNINVTAIGITKAAKYIYETHSSGSLSTSATFSAFRNAMMARARANSANGGLCDEVRIGQAWDAVEVTGLAPQDANACGGGVNAAPTANFSSAVNGLTATFTDSSTDSDGSIASRSWNFGDGTTSSATNPSKTYSAAGTYTVTLTVTDNGGATNTKTSSVTVTSGGGGGTVLTNGVAKTGLSVAKGASLSFTMVVPAGATNLKFVTSGGTGDADLYAKFNAAASSASYDCKSEGTTTAETCSIATAQAGTYYVTIYGYSAASGISLTGSYTAGGGTQTYTNTTDYAIGDNTTVDSPITVSGRTGNAPSNASVTVAIVHTYQGDLKVDLVAPDGTLYNIHNRSGGGTNDVNKTVTLNLSSEALNGTWKLRVNDNAGGDTGKIDSWSITF
jgi:Zn-dependent metalloprotease